MRLAVLLLTLGLLRCTHLPPGATAIDAVGVTGNRHVSADDILEKLATRETPRFVGLVRGVVFDYTLFDPRTLAYDLARVERTYRSLGYYSAHARAGRVLPLPGDQVRIEIVVEEGPVVEVRSLAWHLANPLPGDLYEHLCRIADATLPREHALEETALALLATKLTRALEDHGYAKATVGTHTDVDIARHAATVHVELSAGEPYVFGPLRVVGVGPLPEPAVRRLIDLPPGRPYSRTEIEEAERRLLERGIVSSAHIEPSFDGAAPGVVPLVATVEPARLHEVRAGGGIELDLLKTDVHGRVGWEDRNFLGDLRRFTVDATPGVVLYPTRLSYLQAPTDLLPEERLRVELRQLGFIDPRLEAFVRPELNTYPVLLRETYVPGEPVLGYVEAKTTEGVERFFAARVLHLGLSHSFQYEWPFAYKGPLDPSVAPLVISFVELTTAVDLRDSSVHPHRGVYIGNDLQVAGLGGQPQDIREQPELRGYIPLGKHVTLAARASVGFLFPFNYGVGTDTRDVQIVYFRGFFSGGPSSNRGYPPRGIGPQGDVSLYNPLVNQCLSSLVNAQQCAVPLGGLSLWEATIETRFDVTGPLAAAVFCDAADVSASEVTLSLDRPHLSCGAGVRYETPVGPLRLDIGYRIPGLQALTGTPEYVADLIPGVPIAVSLGLGEAF